MTARNQYCERFQRLSPLERRMHDEASTSAALRAAGVESLDDLPVEGDDESISLDDLVPREYDDEA